MLGWLVPSTARLTSSAVQNGATSVVSFDIREPLTSVYPDMNFLTEEQESKVKYVLGDIADSQVVSSALSAEMECVFHIAAAVGPFIPQPIFQKVNVQGTQNVIDACKAHGIPHLVAASTPSIFFDGNHISGQKPKQLRIVKPGQFLAKYAETKAVAEKIVREANNPPLLKTINIAPHQVYGPRDTLFMPNFICNKDSLRIMGDGKNRVSMCHVDNYCHGLILGLEGMKENREEILGNFYLITDGQPIYLWKVLDELVVSAGGASLYSKSRVPSWLLYGIAYICQAVGWVVGKKFRLNPFNVTMMTIDRFFNIEDSTKDLKYKPVKKFEQGWMETLDWFKIHKEFATMCAEKSVQGKAPTPNKV